MFSSVSLCALAPFWPRPFDVFLSPLFRIFIEGTGINVRNSEPTTCLADLVSREIAASLSTERVVARILAVFENMWDTFIAHKGSFAPFMDLYLERWLHSYVPSTPFLI